jgi:uncharacterized protein
MAGLLTGSQALRGRASVDVVVNTFDFRTAAQYWGIADPTTAFVVHAVLGGTPGYRDLLPPASPTRPTEIAKWLATGPLNPSSALFREDEYLLTEARVLSDRALYHSVITAIAEGSPRQGSIAATLGREQRAVQHPLRALETAGFISRTDDAFRSRRPIYRLTDPIIRFHHVVTRRDLARFEERHTAAAWIDAQPRFSTHILGPHFEEVARSFTQRFASDQTVGGRPASDGPAIVSDAARRMKHEIDVVALGRTPTGMRWSSALVKPTTQRSSARRPTYGALRTFALSWHTSGPPRHTPGCSCSPPPGSTAIWSTRFALARMSNSSISNGCIQGSRHWRMEIAEHG